MSNTEKAFWMRWKPPSLYLNLIMTMHRDKNEVII